MLDNLPDIVTLKECQEVLTIGKNLMLELVHTGKLPAFKVGNRWRISKKSLIEFINSSYDPHKRS